MKDTGIAAEHVFCKKFKAKHITDKKLQYRDIDAQLPDGRYVSIKNQEMSTKTGNFSFETELISTSTGKSMDGNFYNCDAEVYAILAGGVWYIFRSQDLHKYFDTYKSTFRYVKTSHYTEEANRRLGRYYDRAMNYLIPVKDLKPIALKICK